MAGKYSNLNVKIILKVLNVVVLSVIVSQNSFLDRRRTTFSVLKQNPYLDFAPSDTTYS